MKVTSVSTRFLYQSLLVVGFLCSLFQLGDSTCLLVGDNNISALVNQYIDDNDAYLLAYSGCLIGDWDISSVTDLSYLFEDFDFNESIANWDTSNVETMEGMFYFTSSFNQDIGSWDTSSVTDFSFMFSNAISFNQYIGDWTTSNAENMGRMFQEAFEFNQDIGGWDTSKVRDMTGMFELAQNFNKDIGGWDTSSVESMFFMFEKAEAFNQDIGDWSISNVKDLSYTFFKARNFNQDISRWDTSNVLTMEGMFEGSSLFDQDISSWNTSSVLTMEGMFEGSSLFDQDISSWNTSNVLTMKRMFSNSDSFNQDIGGWDTSNVQNMKEMFSYSISFNQDIGGWDTSNVQTMEGMFYHAEQFDQDISSWDTSSVETMYYMFEHATSFDKDIGNWSMSNVKDLSFMFAHSSFNKDIGNWDISSATDLSFMFADSSFNQNINSWNTENVQNLAGMFSGALSFDKPLDNWNTAKVTSIRAMFSNARSFNQNINSWQTSNVVLMNKVFQDAIAFNKTLQDWNTAKVQLMSAMFLGAISYDQPVDNWDVSSVVRLEDMFLNATSFNQPVDSWNVDNVRIMNNMFLNSESFNQTFCWELDNKAADRYLENTNGAVNEFEVDGRCNTLAEFSGDTEVNYLVGGGVVVGSLSSLVILVVVVVIMLRARRKTVEMSKVPIIDVTTISLKVGFGSIIFVLFTYVVFTEIAQQVFGSSAIDKATIAYTDRPFQFSLSEGGEEKLYQIPRMEQGEKYAVQVNDNFDGFLTLYDSDLKVASRMENFEAPSSAPSSNTSVGVVFDYVVLGCTENYQDYYYHFYFDRSDCVFEYENEYEYEGTATSIQDSLERADNNLERILIYTPSSTKDYYLSVKSATTLFEQTGNFLVSKVIPLQQDVPIQDSFTNDQFNNFYEFEVERNGLYQISISDDEFDVIYGVLLDKDGKRLGQTYHYAFTSDDEENKKNKAFFESDFTGTVIMRVFIVTEAIILREEYEEYETAFENGGFLRDFSITLTELTKIKMENNATLNFNDGDNGKALVEFDFGQSGETKWNITFSTPEQFLNYVAVFDTKGNALNYVYVPENPNGYLVAYEQLQQFIIRWGSGRENTKVWLEFGAYRNIEEDVTIEITQRDQTVVPSTPTASPTEADITESNLNFVDSTDPYKFCDTNPEALTLQGPCLDGVLYYCRNDVYPTSISEYEYEGVPSEALSGVCDCVEFLCSVVPSGDADFTFYLQYVHLVFAAVMIPMILIVLRILITHFLTRKGEETKGRAFYVSTSCLLLISFSFSFAQDVVLFYVVEASELFRDIEKVYIPVQERENLNDTKYLNQEAIDVIDESGISVDYFVNLSLSSQVCYVLANMFAILVFLSTCLLWASVGYLSVISGRAKKERLFRKFKACVRFLEISLFLYSIYFTVRIILDPVEYYNNSLSIAEFCACCFIIILYFMSISLLVPKLVQLAKVKSNIGNDEVSQALTSVVLTSSGVIVCLIGVTVGYYYAIIEVQTYDDLIAARNDISLSGIFLAQHVCQVAGQAWILFDLFSRHKKAQSTYNSSKKKNNTNHSKQHTKTSSSKSATGYKTSEKSKTKQMVPSMGKHWSDFDTKSTVPSHYVEDETRLSL